MAHGVFFSQDYNGARQWEDVEDYWPRRLLHIATMTSHKRCGRSRYDHEERPKYSILSYTWGRWADFQADDQAAESESAALEVKGVTWRIPRIKQEHFTAHTFQKVVYEMGRLAGTNWAWVDVACIDQENTPIKMDEVGRQASIFKNAWKAFTWLSHTSTATLDNAISVIETAGADLLQIRNLPEPLNMWVSTAEHRLQAVTDIGEALHLVLDDPWFSSLWTLQELFLRDDALILDREGDSIRPSVPFLDNEPYLGLFYLRYDLQVVMDEMLEIQQSTRPCHDDYSSQMIQELAKELASRIQRSGLAASGGRLAGCGSYLPNNPNMQYSAARFRKTLYQEDRVYAICQIYNIRVGQSLRPNEPPQDLESLVEEFGLAINARSPVLGQLFIHTTPPRNGMSWCITQDSEVPSIVQTLQGDMQINCTICKSANRSVLVEGPSCDLGDFVMASSTNADLSSFDIYLDRHVRQLLDPNGSLPLNPLSDVGHFEYEDSLTKHFAEDSLRIILLGTTEASLAYEYRAVKDDLKPRECYGILIQKCDHIADRNDTVVYQRLGMCHWTLLEPLDKAIPNRKGNIDNLAGDSGSLGMEKDNALMNACRNYASYMKKLFANTVKIELI